MKKILSSTLVILSSVTTCMGSGMLSDVALDSPVFYHREIVIVRVSKQLGGLFIQVADEPFSLRTNGRRVIDEPKTFIQKIDETPPAPKVKARSLRDSEPTHIPEATSNVFTFLREVNARAALKDLVK